MTRKQYIIQLTSSEKSLCGKDIPQKKTASVIDGLCDVISDKDATIADKDTIISERDKQIAKMQDEINWLKRKVFGRSSEKLHAEDPNQLSIDFGEEVVTPLTRDSKPTDAHTEIREAHGTQNCLPGCKAGNSLMASIVTDKFCDHLPEYRQAKRYDAMGIHLPTSSINHWLHMLAGKLKPICNLQAELIFSSKYQHLDESTMRVNDQKHKTRKGYIWSDVDGMGTYGLVFFYDKGSRGEKAISPKLLERKAGIHTDGYVVYQNIEKKKLENLKVLYCMAHAICWA